MPYFGYSRYPANVRTRSIIRLVSSAFRSPSGKARKRSSSSCSFFQASCRPCSKRRSAAPGSKFSTLPRRMGTSMVGRSLQRGLVMSISPTPRMPYLSSQARMASRASRPPASLGSSSRKPSSSTCCRKATTSGCGRITSATSSSASPISDVTLLGTDCASVSAAFFSPSHACSWSLSHQVASIPAMITCMLRGSNWIRFISWMSARMKSSSADPDFVRMSRFKAAMEAWLRAISSATMAGSVSIAAAPATRRRPCGTFVRERRDEVAAVEDGLQRVPDQRIGFPQGSEEARAARRRSQDLRDVDEQPPAGLGHRPRGRQLPHGEPQRLHRVGHHLLMTDGDVDVVLSVAGRGDGEQRGDRPALDDLEVIVDQAPFDVLGAAEVRFDPPAQLREPHDLRIRQRWLLLPLRLDRLFLRPACRRGVDGKLLGANRLGDDLAVPHLVDVRVHQAGDQGLAEAEAGLHGGDLPVARDGVGREQDAGRLREDHLLHDHGHVDLPVVEAVPQAVGHGPLGEERGPAPADVLEDRRRPHDVQVRVLLAREGGRRQVLRRRTGSDGVGGLLAEPGERAGDRRRQIVGDGDPFEGPADLRAERADRLPVVRLQARQPIEPIVDRRRFRHDPLEGVRRHAKASRHAEAFDPRKLPQVRALAANDRDLRLVDLLETQHVAAHPLSPLCVL